MYEKTSFASAVETLISKFPFMSVTVPLVVPFSTTLTPIIGALVSSNIVPLTDFFCCVTSVGFCA